MNDKRDNITNNNSNLSAQNVHSFAVQEQNNDVEDIKNRIDSSKKNNLDSNMKRTSKDDNLVSSSSSDLDSVKSGKKIDPKNLAKSGVSMLANGALNKASQSDSHIGDAARLGQKAVETTKFAKKLTALLKKPVIGKILLVVIIAIIGFILLIGIGLIISDPLQLIVSSVQMKFGLTSDKTYESLTDEDEEYNVINGLGDRVYQEGMSREEIEEIINSSNNDDGTTDTVCKIPFFRRIANLFGSFDMSDPCEFVQYLKTRIEKKENRTNISNITPGYLMNTFYYAYETQNYKADGSPTLTVVSDDNDDNDKETSEIMSDLDAINLLFSKKMENGKYIFERKDIDTLLDQYILEVSYTYWNYEKTSKEGVVPEVWECVPRSNTTYNIDTTKYELFLRYGENVSTGNLGYRSGNRGYEADKVINAAYAATSKECVEEVRNRYGEKPPSLGIYDTRAYPDVVGDDNAYISLADGKTYTYQDGFIWNRYPRYIKEFTVDNVEPEFNYAVAKEIEKTIELQRDRQDYSNYLLGYDSEIGDLLKKNQNSTSTVVCDYSEVSSDSDSSNTVSTNYKVQLMYPYKDNFSFDAFEFDSNTPITDEYIDIEKYVLGTVFAEAGDTPWQESMFITNSEATSKAFSIMTRSFLMANANKSSTDGNVLQIANSTTKQTYCDPDEGCYRCYSNSNRNNIVMLPIDSDKAINNSQCTKVEPLPENSLLRKYVKETAGQVMINSSNNVASTGYDNDRLSKWLKSGNPDSSLANYDYTELLYYQYGKDGYSLKGVECKTIYSSGTNYIASGDWDNWKQGSGSPWANQKFGAGATMANAGCLITSFSKLIADANPSSLTIPNFNPGNFAQILTDNNCFEGNNLRNTCALDVAVGSGNYTYEASTLSGTFENKRALITSFLNDGYKVIISVKGDGHWVYVTGTTDTDILMSDPASSHGNSNSVLKTYGNTSQYYKKIKFK